VFAEESEKDLKKICLECNKHFRADLNVCPDDGTLLVHVAQDPLLGTTLAGNYQIQSVIGHGGMGVVYKARHVLMDRTVAIKMLRSQLISDSMTVKRFQQESKAASRINHPHVITVYDFGISTSGQPYIVMDYLKGISLAEIIRSEGHVGVERCIKILGQACDALDYAHRQGVVHRDLKPSNIVLINYDGDSEFVKVVDFGVAKLMPMTSVEEQKLTQAGEVCGSPVYMSPEQCLGQELDTRSDIYSMGIVLYESLTGKLPILGSTMVDTMSKHISEEPQTFTQARPDLYIPERIEAVVFKTLRKNPADRHESMADLKFDLETAIPRPGKSVTLRTTPTEPKFSSEKHTDSAIKKVPVGLWAALAVLVVWTCGIYFYLMSLRASHIVPNQAARDLSISPAVVPSTKIKRTIPNQTVTVNGSNKTTGSKVTTSPNPSTIVPSQNAGSNNSANTDHAMQKLHTISKSKSKTTPAHTIAKHKSGEKAVGHTDGKADVFEDLLRSRGY
jgi:serine/threonine-protein kinase